mgnify:CR=1 FL=1
MPPARMAGRPDLLTHVVRYVNPAFRQILGPAPARYNRSHSHYLRSPMEKRLMDTPLTPTIPGLDHIPGGCLPSYRFQAKTKPRA